MNINSATTKTYEMNSLADPSNTNPILPGLKRQLYPVRVSFTLMGSTALSRCKVGYPAHAREAAIKIPVFPLTFGLKVLYSSCDRDSEASTEREKSEGQVYTRLVVVSGNVDSSAGNGNRGRYLYVFG